MKRLLKILFMLLFCAEANAATFYVAQNGSHSNCTAAQSSSTPSTITAILNNNSCNLGGNDEVHFRSSGGAFTTKILLTAGSATVPIKLKNFSGETPTFTPTVTNTDAAVEARNVSVWIEGLNITGHYGPGISVVAYNNSLSNVTIINNTINGNINTSSGGGIAINVQGGSWLDGPVPCHNCTITNITVQGNKATNIATNGGETFNFNGGLTNLKVLNNTIDTVTDIALVCLGMFNGPTNVLIQGNTIKNATGSTFGPSNNSGIYLDNCKSNIIIQDNYVENTGFGIVAAGEHGGIHVSPNHQGTVNAIIRRNVVRNTIFIFGLGSGGGGSDCQPEPQGFTSDSVLVHNTGYGGSNTFATLFMGCGRNNRVKNNIFAGHAANIWYHFVNTGNLQQHHATWQLNGNRFWDNVASSTTMFFSWNNYGNTVYDSLANFRTGTGHEANGSVGNPNFVNVSTGNFNLQSGSPAIDAGTALTTTSGTCSGTAVPVNDARYFTNGFGLTTGDQIAIGGTVRAVVGVNYATNTITVDSNVTCASGAAVSYFYGGSGPDQGAFEFDAPPTPGRSGTVVASVSSVAPSSAITANVNIADAGNVGDWVAIFVPGTPGSAFLAWFYLNNTQVKPVAPRTGAVAVNFTSPATAGNYEFRLYANDSQSASDLLDSDPFTVTGAVIVTIKRGAGTTYKIGAGTTVKVGQKP